MTVYDPVGDLAYVPTFSPLMLFPTEVNNINIFQGWKFSRFMIMDLHGSNRTSDNSATMKTQFGQILNQGRPEGIAKSQWSPKSFPRNTLIPGRTQDTPNEFVILVRDHMWLPL